MHSGLQDEERDLVNYAALRLCKKRMKNGKRGEHEDLLNVYSCVLYQKLA